MSGSGYEGTSAANNSGLKLCAQTGKTYVQTQQYVFYVELVLYGFERGDERKMTDIGPTLLATTTALFSLFSFQSEVRKKYDGNNDYCNVEHKPIALEYGVFASSPQTSAILRQIRTKQYY